MFAFLAFKPLVSEIGYTFLNVVLWNRARLGLDSETSKFLSLFRSPTWLNRRLQLVSFVFHFRPRDGALENCFFFFKFRLMHVHPRAYVCIIHEKTKGKFPEEHHVVWLGKTKHTRYKGGLRWLDPFILWGYHPTLKLSGIPTFTLIEVQYIAWITYISIYNIACLVVIVPRVPRHTYNHVTFTPIAKNLCCIVDWSIC